MQTLLDKRAKKKIIVPKQWMVVGMRKDGNCDYGRLRFKSEEAAYDFLNKLEPKKLKPYLTTFILPKEI